MILFNMILDQEKEWIQFLNETDKIESDRVSNEYLREQPYQDEFLNYIYPWNEDFVDWDNMRIRITIDEIEFDVWEKSHHINTPG